MDKTTPSGDREAPPCRLWRAGRGVLLSTGFAAGLALSAYYSAAVPGAQPPGLGHWISAQAPVLGAGDRAPGGPAVDPQDRKPAAGDEKDIVALDEKKTAALDGKQVAAVDETKKPGEPALSDEMRRVRDWVAGHYRVSRTGLEPALAEVELNAREQDLDPLLLVAIIAVESSFNPSARSHAGALGLMQVIPRWHWDKIGRERGEEALYEPRFNVRIGTQVLVEGLQRYGSLEDALQYYNGARHDPERRYSRRVMSVKQQLLGVARDDA